MALLPPPLPARVLVCPKKGPAGGDRRDEWRQQIRASIGDVISNASAIITFLLFPIPVTTTTLRLLTPMLGFGGPCALSLEIRSCGPGSIYAADYKNIL